MLVINILLSVVASAVGLFTWSFKKTLDRNETDFKEFKVKVESELQALHEKQEDFRLNYIDRFQKVYSMLNDIDKKLGVHIASNKNAG